VSRCINENDIKDIISSGSEEGVSSYDLREDISVDSSYQLLRNARNQARNDERLAQSRGEPLPTNSEGWEFILNKVPEVLKHESKDIELVAWYIEALTRKYGFQGLASGFSLARQMIEAYGEQLHPHPDEEGLSSQLSALAGLNGFGSEGVLIYPIKAIHISQGDIPGPLAIWQCEQFLDTERISDVDKREARYKSIGITKTQFDMVFAETEDQFLYQVRDNIVLAIEEYKKYQVVLDEYTREDPLPTTQILDTLMSCQQVLLYVVGDRLKKENKSEIPDESISDSDSIVQVNQVKHISQREEALQSLRDVAAFFRKTEPHSPISYSIEQAIRWSSMPLTELIKELIPDDSARGKFQNLSGIGTSKTEAN
jgi:type VI secretion system protein ImpA